MTRQEIAQAHAARGGTFVAKSCKPCFVGAIARIQFVDQPFRVVREATEEEYRTNRPPELSHLPYTPEPYYYLLEPAD